MEKLQFLSSESKQFKINQSEHIVIQTTQSVIEKANTFKAIQPHSQVGKINTMKISILLEAIYRFQCNLYQTRKDILHRTKEK